MAWSSPVSPQTIGKCVIACGRHVTHHLIHWLIEEIVFQLPMNRLIKSTNVSQNLHSRQPKFSNEKSQSLKLQRDVFFWIFTLSWSNYPCWVATFQYSHKSHVCPVCLWMFLFSYKRWPSEMELPKSESFDLISPLRRDFGPIFSTFCEWLCHKMSATNQTQWSTKI